MKKFSLLLSLILVLTLSFSAALAEEWACPNCGKTNTTKFCTSCGLQHNAWTCPNCGAENDDAFCGECGTAKPTDPSFLFGTWKDTAGNNTFLVFRDDGTFLIALYTDGMAEGTYTVTADQITLYADNDLTETLDYSYTDGQLYIGTFNLTYARTEEPPVFVVTMDGVSMLDTIPVDTGLVFTCKDPDDIHRFDIAAVHYPERGNTVFVKRIVGLPGDTVELRDGVLYVNGVRCDEPYVSDEYRTGSLNSFGPYTVPEGYYFVLGDHRNNSNDSRRFGPLPAGMIIGILN